MTYAVTFTAAPDAANLMSWVSVDAGLATEVTATALIYSDSEALQQWYDDRIEDLVMAQTDQYSDGYAIRIAMTVGSNFQGDAGVWGPCVYGTFTNYNGSEQYGGSSCVLLTQAGITDGSQVYTYTHNYSESFAVSKVGQDKTKVHTQRTHSHTSNNNTHSVP